MTKRKFNVLLKKNKLNIKNFSILCEVPYGTILNCNDVDKPIPHWVKSWLYLYEKSKKYDELLLHFQNLNNIH